MHICFLTPEYPKAGFPHGGVGSFAKTIAVELVKRGFRVSVIGLNYTAEDEIEHADGVDVYRVGRSRVAGLAWWFNQKAINAKIRQIHSQTPIDVIEASEIGLAFVRKIKGIRYVIRLHGGHHFFAEAEKRSIDTWKGFQEKNSFAKADAFVAVSDYVKSHTAKYLSYRNKLVTSISYPINTQLFRPLEVAVVPFRIVFAGTVCEKKGVRQLIQAFPLIKKDFPDATLEIYGRDWFFRDGSSFIKMLREKELPQLGSAASYINFHGAVAHTDLPENYARAHVCVFPSHMETQGLVAPEAMLMEKTVVFTKMGPGPETITDGETGLLCDPYSPEDIADKIRWAFSNLDRLALIGKNAREAALAKYSLDHIIELNLDFYRSLKK